MSDPVVQTAKSQNISLLPLNGTTFTAQKKVIFELPPSLGFIRASRDESYLVFTVRNSGTARWMFPTSGQCLIDRVDITSMETGQPLESLQQYNKAMWILDQYNKVSHSIGQSSEGMRRFMTSLQTFSNGATASRLISSDETPDSVMNSIISPITETGAAVFQGWKVVVPLRAGIFNCFSEEKLTPLMALGGLRIEFTLADTPLVCVPIQPILDSQEFRIVHTSTLPWVVTQGAAGTSQLSIANQTIVGTELVPGQMIHVKATGLAIQAVRITSLVQSGTSVLVNVDTASDVSGGNGKLFQGPPVSNGGAGLTATLADTTIEKSGLVVGQSVTFSDDGTTVATAKVITALAQAGADVTITFVGNLDLSGGNGMMVVTPSQWSAGATYAIDALEYRVQQMIVPPQISQKLFKNGLDYSFRSWDLFFDSIPAASRRHQVEIPSVTSMGKSIMSHFTFSSKEQDPNMPQYYTGAHPDELYLNSLQFFINNKQMPLRPYDPRRTRDRPQQLNELQKAFSAMGQKAKSFGIGSGSNLDGYSNTFLACRELARGRYVYSLREAEPSMRLAFTSTRDEVVRVDTLVWADKIINVSAVGLSVIL